MTVGLGLLSQTQSIIDECTIKFHCQNHTGLSGLFLLAAFSKLSGGKSGSLIEPWSMRRWLCVAAQLHGNK